MLSFQCYLLLFYFRKYSTGYLQSLSVWQFEELYQFVQEHSKVHQPFQEYSEVNKSGQEYKQLWDSVRDSLDLLDNPLEIPSDVHGDSVFNFARDLKTGLTFLRSSSNLKILRSSSKRSFFQQQMFSNINISFQGDLKFCSSSKCQQ